MNSKQVMRLVTVSSKTLKAQSLDVYARILTCLLTVHSSSDPDFASVAGYVRARDWSRVLGWATAAPPLMHGDSDVFFPRQQIINLIKKYPFPSHLGIADPERKAKETFAVNESRCSELNKTVKGVLDSSEYHIKTARMRSFISYVLGEQTPYQDVLSRCDFGPGASIGVNGENTNIARKILARDWSVSPGAYHYGCAAIALNHQLRSVLLESKRYPQGSRGWDVCCYDAENFRAAYLQKANICKYNKISFVPKTALTHRSIAVEPLINGFVQKGIDNFMRERLKRVGIDLSDQDINAEYARVGSKDWRTPNSFATIDLSSASDSISIELVRHLLPYDWFAFLDETRSKYYKLDGDVQRYHKFCSMGNGFCFPLETLLFAAACVACDCGKPGTDFLVYGDDIVVQANRSEDVIALLTAMGFRTNSEKTYVSGPFRESCGRDWFDGEDVRPFVLDFALDSVESVIKFLNLSRRSERVERFLWPARDLVRDLVPRAVLFERPCEGPPDSGVTVDFDTFMSSPHAKYQRDIQTWTWKTLCTRACADFLREGDGSLRERPGYDDVVMIAALRGSSSALPFAVRRKTRTTVKGSHPTR